MIPCLGILLSSVFSCALAQEIPAGFKVERYTRLWERNPFMKGAVAAPQARASVFDKLFLASWLIDAGKEVICVQNSETNEVQRITAESNQNNLHLVGMHLSPNPQLVEAIISDGKEQGAVKYRLGDQHLVGPTTSTTAQTPNYNAPFGRQSNSTGTAPQPAVNLPNAQSPGSPASAPVNHRPPHRGIPVYRPGVG